MPTLPDIGNQANSFNFEVCNTCETRFSCTFKVRNVGTTAIRTIRTAFADESAERLTSDEATAKARDSLEKQPTDWTAAAIGFKEGHEECSFTQDELMGLFHEAEEYYITHGLPSDND